ncbi:hypothetical protein E4U59_000804 [Claviceps monticola]|nr:hypothetical protein E4U59_000804 [Claviceps monticola]
MRIQFAYLQTNARRRAKRVRHDSRDREQQVKLAISIYPHTCRPLELFSIYISTTPRLKTLESNFIANNSTMVRILSIFITTLAAVCPVAHAGVCVPGLQYCGSTLKDSGKDSDSEAR